MKVATLGSLGVAGSFILAEALAHSEIHVTAIVRSPEAVTPHDGRQW